MAIHVCSIALSAALMFVRIPIDERGKVDVIAAGFGQQLSQAHAMHAFTKALINAPRVQAQEVNPAVLRGFRAPNWWDRLSPKARGKAILLVVLLAVATPVLLWAGFVALNGKARFSREMRRLARQHDEYGAANEESVLMMDLLLYALRAAGGTGEREMQFARQVVAGLQLQQADDEAIRKWLAKTPQPPAAQYLRELFLNSTFVLRLKMFRAAYIVAGLQGGVSASETKFLQSLAGAFNFEQRDIAHACSGNFDPERYDQERWRM